MRPKTQKLLTAILLLIAPALLQSANSICRADEAILTLSVVDKDTGNPIACRIQLRSAAGKPVKVPGAINWADHAVIDGKVALKLPVGAYTFTLERGLEYLDMTGHFRLEHFADDSKQIELHRYCNLAKEGWWSGDLDVERRDKDLPLVMQAEDLHFVPLTTFSSTKSEWAKRAPPHDGLVKLDENRCFQLFAGGDTLPGGSLLYCNLEKPLDLKALHETKEGSPLDLTEQVKKQPGAAIVARSLCDWDMPTWVALQKLDAVSVVDHQYGREGMLPAGAAGRPYDRGRYPPPLGVARYEQQVYFHLLNCGIRIPPVAGSGNGETTNPAGYGRTYVFCGQEFSADAWWQGVREGKTVVTNGPLLRPDVEGHPPGYVFELPAGQTKDIEIALTLSTRDKIAYLELIQDGHVAHEVRLDAFTKAGGKLPHLNFEKSGWFLVRAVADNAKTYRFAMTAPYYVQIGDQPRISKQSAEFFVQWMKDREAELKLDDPKQREAALAEIHAARQFWDATLAKAKVD